MTQETFAAREVAAAVHDVADAIRARRVEPRGYQSAPRLPVALAWALRVCRFRDESGWHGLAEHVKRVPAEYVGRVCVLGDRSEAWSVACLCGSAVVVTAELEQCAGGCGRWYVADDRGAWSIRLPS